MMSFLCPACGMVLRAPEERAGAVTSCLRCHKALRVPPVPTRPAVPPSAPVGPRPTAAPGSAPSREPAPATGAEWFFARGHRRAGPASWAQLQKLAAAGRLRPSDRVWNRGMAKPVEAGSLRGLFPASPPPTSPEPAPAESPPARPRLWKRAVGEAWEIGKASLQQAVRPALYLHALVRRRGLRKTARTTQVAFGQKLYEAGAGDRQLREQVRSLGEQIHSAEAAGARTGNLAAERRELLARLAEPFVGLAAPPAVAPDAYHKASGARSRLQEHERRMKAAGGLLLPAGWAGWRRVGIGYGLVAAVACALLLLPGNPPTPPAGGTVARKVPLKDISTQEIYAASAKSVALIRGEHSSGTGFLVRPNLLATNAHVVDFTPAGELKVYFPSAGEAGKNPRPARVVYFDGRRDLALLEVKTDLEPLAVAEDYQYQGGQGITVIGNPGVAKQTMENAVSQGVMSTRTKIRGKDYYQLSISVNPGNSGGPVFDSKGRVIGVVTLKAKNQEGIAFCIPPADLHQAVAAAGNTSAERRAEMASRHTLAVVFRRVSLAGKLYSKGMELTTRCLQEASRRRQPLAVGVEIAKRIFEEKFKDADKELVGDVREVVTQVGSDQHLPEKLRNQMVELWTTYQEMKSYVEDPRGTLAGYVSKSNELTDRYKRLVESMRLTLGMEEMDDDD